MKVLGINIQKDQLRYSLLEGSKGSPTLLSSGRLNFDSDMPIGDLMVWFRRNFEAVLAENRPHEIAYRCSTTFSKQLQIPYLIFPYGVLELIAKDNDIQCHFVGPKAITNKALGFEKADDQKTKCDEILGKHPPYWDNNQRNSAFVAWMKLR